MNDENAFVTRLAALRVSMLREGLLVESLDTTYRAIAKHEGRAFPNGDALVAQAEALAARVVANDPAGPPDPPYLAEVEAALRAETKAAKAEEQAVEEAEEAKVEEAKAEAKAEKKAEKKKAEKKVPHDPDPRIVHDDALDGNFNTVVYPPADKTKVSPASSDWFEAYDAFDPVPVFEPERDVKAEKKEGDHELSRIGSAIGSAASDISDEAKKIVRLDEAAPGDATAAPKRKAGDLS